MNNTTDTSSGTSTKEKVVVGGAIIGGLICFGFLTNTCKSPVSHFNNENQSKVAAVSSDDEALNAKITDLETRLEVLKDNSADEKVIADLEAQLYNQRLQAADRVQSLKEHTASLEEQVKNLSSAGAVSPLVQQDSSAGEGAVVDESAVVDELNAKINSLSSELELAQNNVADLTNKLNAKPVENADLAKLTNKVKFLNADNIKLADQLKLMKAKLSADNSDSEQISKLNSRINELTVALKSQKDLLEAKEGQIADLNANVNKMKAAKNVFAKSADDLPEKAQGLLKDLKTLEGKNKDEVAAEYKQYLTTHKATARKRITFASGSAALSANDKKEIAQLTQDAGRNTYFFIVGYADKSGSAASNEKLSSARSTSVAKELGINAKANQSAQAVYLGQTDRFGPPTENRVVEIWEIK